MRVLSVASEAYPLVKTGGLADVAGALPAALAGHGVEVRTLLPGYPSVMARIHGAETAHVFPDLFGTPARLLAAEADGLSLLVLDAPDLFDRPGNPYANADGRDYADNWRRFAALAKAGAEIAAGRLDGWRPDLVHAHDWQAAMTPVYMRYGEANAVPSVVTVHNLAFQGQFDASIFGELGLPGKAFGIDGVEYYGGVGYLKGGLRAASAITTVSPTYAHEITTAEFGMGLDGLIRTRAGDLSGIVNGIDTDVWNPETDRALEVAFTAASLARRAANRTALARRMKLDDDGGPLFVVVSRLTWQKGIDLLADSIDALVAAGGRLAVLGSGDKALEDALIAASERHSGRVALRIGYDEPLSHLLQGGGDAILVPSRFEPCGLTQLYALRYGCVPVVARTGGLADTVIDANEAALAAGAATGILFSPGDEAALRRAIMRTAALHARSKVWTRLARQGMKTDVSWQRSAGRYAALFHELTQTGPKT